MKHLLQSKLQTTLLLTLLFGVSACGQKGPLVVEEPPVEPVTTQEEEPAETK